MRTTIEAGREIDIATPDDVGNVVSAAMRAHQRTLMRAPEFATVRASSVTLPGYGGRTVTTGTTPIGPRPGRVWAVQRLSVHGGWVSLYTDDGSPSSYITQVGGQPGGMVQFARGALILRNGQTLYVANMNANAITVTVSLAIADAAVGDEWML